MENRLADLSCTAFTEKTASPVPVPGGGGVSALAGALAVSLGDMVGGYTVGKKKYADVEPEIRKSMEICGQLRCRFLELIDEDAKNFKPLSEAYGIPKDAEGREEEMERCLRLAVKAPLEIYELCIRSIDQLGYLEENGSRLIVSDAATGAALARGALQGAAVNIRVNTRLMKDRETAERINQHVEATLPVYSAKAEQIFAAVYGELSVRKNRN